MAAKKKAAPKVSAPAIMKKLTFRELAKAAGFESVKKLFLTRVEKDSDGDVVGDAENVYMCRVYGEAVRSRVASTQYGESVYFLGRFKAIIDGMAFTSGKIFLPEYIATEIEASMQETKGAVQFGFDVFLKPRDDLSIGYEFIGVSLFDAADPFGAMEAALPPLQLTGPDAAE